MISTLSIWNDLVPLFELLGAAGLFAAVVAAAMACVAAAHGHGEAVGVSTGIWLASVLLSACAAYSGGWWVIGAALCVYPAALIVFGVVRSIKVRASARQAVRRVEQPAREQRVKVLAP